MWLLRVWTLSCRIPGSRSEPNGPPQLRTSSLRGPGGSPSFYRQRPRCFSEDVESEGGGIKIEPLLAPFSGHQAFVSRDFLHPGQPWGMNGILAMQGISHLISCLNSGCVVQIMWSVLAVRTYERSRIDSFDKYVLKQHIVFVSWQKYLYLLKFFSSFIEL